MTAYKIDLYQNNRVRDVLPHRVFARSKWSDPWEEKPGVFCTMASWAASPNLPEATLHYRYGLGRQEGDSETSTWAPFDLPALAFVKIVFRARALDENETEGDVEWYGVAGRLVDQMAGRADNPASPDPTGPVDIVQQPVDMGVQTIHCVGMEWLLQQHQIHDSWVRWTTGTWDVVRNTRALAFGQNREPQRRPMGDPILQPSTYVFASGFRTLDECSQWFLADVAEYLLTWQVPRTDYSDPDDPDTWPVKWKLVDPDVVVPTKLARGLEVDGETTWSVLNRIIPRFRARGWRTVVNSNGTEDVVEVRPFSYLQTSLSLPDSTSAPGNTRQYTLATNLDYGTSLSIATDAFAKYDRVVARGGPYVMMWTQVLERQAEQEYTSAIPDTTGLLHFAARMVRRVRQYFGADGGRLTRFIVDKFSRRGTSSNPINGAGTFPIGWPVDSVVAAGTYPPSSSIYVACPAQNMRVLPTIPITSGGTYTATTPPADAATLDIRDGSPPQVFILPTYRSDGTLNATGATATVVNGAAAAQATSGMQRVGGPYSLLPVDDHSGAHELFSSGPNLAQAWTGSSLGRRFGGTPTAHETEFVIETTGSAGATRSTVHEVYTTIASDFGGQRLEIAVDVGAADPGTIVRTKVLDCGSAYQLHVAAKHTIVGVENHGTIPGDQKPVITSDPIILRDDRDELEAVAQAALAWYRQERRAVAFATSYLTTTIQVGDMVTEMVAGDSAVTVNSVVTQITLSQDIGGGVQRVEYSLAHAEMDLFPE
jgi:hypothetical protein